MYGGERRSVRETCLPFYRPWAEPETNCMDVDRKTAVFFGMKAPTARCATIRSASPQGVERRSPQRRKCWYAARFAEGIPFATGTTTRQVRDAMRWFHHRRPQGCSEWL